LRRLRENNSVLISITIVSSSTNSLEYIWAENCEATTSCGHEKYSQDYFNLQYDTISYRQIFTRICTHFSISKEECQSLLRRFEKEGKIVYVKQRGIRIA